MKIAVNGKFVDVGERASVIDLLNLMNLEQRQVAVAINKEFVARTLFSETFLSAEDNVEIVSPMAGG